LENKTYTNWKYTAIYGWVLRGIKTTKFSWFLLIMLRKPWGLDTGYNMLINPCIIKILKRKSTKRNVSANVR